MQILRKMPGDRVQASVEQAGLPATGDSFYLLGRVYPDDSGGLTQVLLEGVSGERLGLGSATVIITSGDSDAIFSDGFE